MNELFISLPDGKTELPARLIVNKMGSSVHLDLKAEFSLKQKEENEKIHNTRSDQRAE
jgi:hypothetical protein